jgi:hypothetical protein
MKQIIMVAIASIMLLIGSCGPKEQYYYVTYTILNKSDHKIELFIFKHNNTVDTILLPTFRSDTMIETRQEGRVSDPPPFVTDSVRVTYDDTISIVHFRTAKQDASRSIIRSESWTGGSTGGQDYAWEYLFTNDDYEEAVLLQ